MLCSHLCIVTALEPEGLGLTSSKFSFPHPSQQQQTSCWSSSTLLPQSFVPAVPTTWNSLSWQLPWLTTLLYSNVTFRTDPLSLSFFSLFYLVLFPFRSSTYHYLIVYGYLFSNSGVPSPAVCGLLGTGLRSRRWTEGEWAKLPLLLPIAPHRSPTLPIAPHRSPTLPIARITNWNTQPRRLWKICLPRNRSLVPKMLGTRWANHLLICKFH